MKSRVLIIGLLFSLSNLFSQTNNEIRDLYDDGDYFFQRKDYPEAFYYFVQILKYDPNNANINYKAGACLINMPGQEKKAIPMLKKAVLDITQNYNRRSYNERNAPLHALYYLGNAYRINNDIDKALEAYNKFVNAPEFYGNYNERMVYEEIKSCERAKIIRDFPIQTSEKNLGAIINTKSNDYSAVISGNGNVLVYANTLKFYEGLFYSVKENGLWTEPVNINAQVISDGDMFPTGLSFDGKELLLVKKSDVNNDIYYSTFSQNLWTKALPLDDPINSRQNEDYASFSKDAQTIFFTSDRRGGYGGFDIYKTKKTAKGWSEPENLGETVNSPFNEAAPFLTEDGKKLYFSSNGHFNMGGFDIFYSENVEGIWQRPENVGYPLNTTNDNIFFVPINNGNTGLISLLRDDGYGDQDIYLISIGKKDENLQSDLEQSMQKMDMDNSVKLKLIDEEKRDTTIIFYNKATERFLFDVPKGVKVIFED